MRWRTQVEWSQCERLLIVDLLHLCRKWVVWLWWVHDGMSSSVPFVVVLALFASGREWVSTGWCCCGCVLAYILSMHTSSSSCHTPAADVIECEHLFHVVYKGHLCSSTHLISVAP